MQPMVNAQLRGDARQRREHPRQRLSARTAVARRLHPVRDPLEALRERAEPGRGTSRRRAATSSNSRRSCSPTVRISPRAAAPSSTSRRTRVSSSGEWTRYARTSLRAPSRSGRPRRQSKPAKGPSARRRAHGKPSTRRRAGRPRESNRRRRRGSPAALDRRRHQRGHGSGDAGLARGRPELGLALLQVTRRLRQAPASVGVVLAGSSSPACSTDSTSS